MNYKQGRPTWVPDNSASACVKCKQAFSFDIRRHHCRHCGQIFCHYCSSKTRSLPCLSYHEPVRICDLCSDACDTKDAYMDAVRLGDLETVRAMLQSGAVAADDATGIQTPLLVSASKDNTDMIALLLEHDANVHALPSHIPGRPSSIPAESLPRGDSPLHYAAINGSVEACDQLLSLGAAVDRRSLRYGETPLHKAVLFGHHAIVLTLLAAGASPTLNNDRCLSPGMVCGYTGDDAMVAAFGQHGHTVESIGAKEIYADESINPEERPQLLWDVLTCLYLYKRPRRARVLLSESVVAMHVRGYDVESIIPQLCDLALHEPPGDNSMKLALLTMSATCATLSFGVWYFMRSVQEASPQTAKAFIEVMEASVFGTVAPAHAPIVGTGTPQSGAAVTPPGARASPSSPGDTTPQTPVTPVGVGAHQSGGGAHSSGGASHRTPVGYDADPSSPQEGSSSGKQRNKFVRDDTIESWEGLVPGVAGADALAATLMSQVIALKGADAVEHLRVHGREAFVGSGSGGVRESSWCVAPTQKERRSMLLKSRKLVRVLTDIGAKLPAIPALTRKKELQLAIQRINEKMPPCCYVPVFQGRFRVFWVLNIPPDEVTVFRTNKRVPFMVVAEIQAVVRSQKGRRLGSGSGMEEGEEEGGEGRWRMREDGGEEEDGGGRPGGPQGEWGAAPSGPEDGLLLERSQVKLMQDIFGESWEDRVARIRCCSPHGHLPNWALVSFIVKSGDDLRQEQFAMQLIEAFTDIFDKAKLRLWLRPYRIVSTSADSGLIECVHDTVSLNGLRDKLFELKCPDLASYFRQQYGPESSPAFKLAQRNFIESMAGYAVVCYLLQVKDRNDGNLLLTRTGHILHIDYGYMLTNTPGDMGFEQAPFKLTSEFVDVMGGKDSASFAYFRELIVQGFLEARKAHNYERIIMLIEMISNGVGGELSMPCVAGQSTAEIVALLREMFMIGKTEEEVRQFVDNMIDVSLNNWYTRQYDNYQVLQKTLSGLFGNW